MKEKIISLTFIIICFLVPIIIFTKEDTIISNYERRKLETKEDLKKDFLGNIDTYMTDQFPFRNNLINISNIFNRYVLLNYENNDVYIYKDYIIDKNSFTNKKSINIFINKINNIIDTYLDNSNVYISIIPDKAYFLTDDYLKLDYDYIYKEILNINAKYINLKDEIKLSDYYKTDIHLKQESYIKLLKVLNKYMNFNYKESKYEKVVLNDFKGSSYSKVPSYFKSENLIYLKNNIIDNTEVKHLEYDIDKVYDLDSYESVDPYNIFLSGPSAYIELTNNKSTTNKELILFRDSFGSSISPILSEYYKKITLIDLRYVKLDYILDKVNFNNSDILFLYSTLIVNSDILK